MQYVKKNQSRSTGYFIMIMRLALPIIIQGLVFQLQAVVNKSFLGKLDTNYLSAVGVAQFPFFTSTDALMAICTGLTIVVAHKFGASKLKEIHESVNASIAFNMIFSLLLFALWFLFPDTIFSLMNVDDTLVHHCNDYVRILSYFFLLFGIDISLQETLQGMGKTKQIMYVGLIKIGLNILLDWILIFGKFGLPAMYIKGAAWATTISNVVGTILLLTYFIVSKELSANLKLKEILRFRWSLYKEIIRLGLPTCIEFTLWNISNLILISLLNKQGVTVVAIFTVTFAIELFVYKIFNGIAKATLTLVGNCIGAGNVKATNNIMNSSIRYSFVFVTIFCIIFAIIPKPILAIFTNDKELIEMSVFYLIARAVTMFPKTLNVVVGSGIRARGDVKWMLYTQLIGSIFVVAFSYGLIHVFKVGAFAIYLTLFMDEFLRATLNTIRFYKGNILVIRKNRGHKKQERPIKSEA